MDKTTMIKALEVASGHKARRHDKWENQFFFTVNGVSLWVGVYAEYEITADGKGKTGTRIPCSLVEAAAYVKSGGTVIPADRGVVSGSLFKKSESQRELHRAVDIFAQIDAMTTESKPAAVPAVALVNPVLQAAVEEKPVIAEPKADDRMAALENQVASLTASMAALVAALTAKQQ